MRLQDILPQNLEKFSNDELKATWLKLSDMWKIGNINKEEVINRAIFIINEFVRRKIDIEKTELYSVALKWKEEHKESDYLKVYPSGEKSGDQDITLEEVRKYYEKPIKLEDNCVSLVGGVVVHGKSKNDFEALLRLPPREELIRRINFRLDRAIEDLKLRPKQHILDDYFGPFTDYLPLYDLVLVPVEKKEIIKMSVDSIVEQLVRSKSPESEKTAEKAKKDDKLTPLEFFYPLKSAAVTMMGYRVGEKYSVDQMIDFLKKLGAKENKDFIAVQIQKKYDGVSIQIHKNGDKIKIFSDDGSDITDRLPSIVKQTGSFKAKDLILACEMELWSPDHRPREEVSGYLHEKGKPNDSNIIANIFDCLYYNEDIHNEPYSKRLEYIGKLGVARKTLDRPDLKKKVAFQNFNIAPHYFADNEKDARKYLELCSKSEASEGAMVKISDFKYSLSGTTRDILKLKTYAEAHAIVWKVNQTKVTTVFNYDFALGFTAQDKIDPKTIVKIGDKDYTKAGRSYDTSVKAEVGDIITIRFHTANLYKDPKTGTERIHLYEPVFYEKREKAEEPDKISTVVEIAASAGILTRKMIEAIESSGMDWFKDFHKFFMKEGFASDWVKIEQAEKHRRIDEAYNLFKYEIKGANLCDEVLSECRNKNFRNFEIYFLKKFQEQEDPFLRYPDESKDYKCVLQHHYRGKSVHLDLRNEHEDTLIGWTLNDQLPAEIKEEVTTLQQAKALDKKDVFKINYTNGEWKQRLKKGAVKPVNVSIVCEKKAPQPMEWLNIEGVAEIGEIGATKTKVGVFSIVHRGTVEYLSQKPWSHEYQYHAGPIDYRIVFRRLKLKFVENMDSSLVRAVTAQYLCERDLEEKIQEAIDNPSKMMGEVDLTGDIEIMEAEKIIPPGKGGFSKEEEAGAEVGWLAIKPLEQTPYILSNEAVKKAFIPPLGYSALTKKIRKQIPAEFQYWKAKTKNEAIDLRDALVEAMKKKEVNIKEAVKNDFVLQSHWWKGPTAIRFGPSREHFDIRIDTGEPTLIHMVLEYNPLQQDDISFYLKPTKDKSWMKRGEKIERIEPGEPGNPTKNTPAWIQMLDKGKVTIFERKDTFMKMEFDGKKLKGLWVAERESPSSEFWRLKRSELPLEKKA